MSSVIVLDSSDEEEVPAKKAFVAPSIPATITPIKGTNTQPNQVKQKKSKARPIPSGITITRRSPVTVTAVNPNSQNNSNNNNGTNASAAGTKAMPPNSGESFAAATISAATLAATSKLNSVLSKASNTSSILKVNTPTTINNAHLRQMASGASKALTQQQTQKTQNLQQKQQTQSASKQQPQQQQQVLPHLSQLPQLQPSPLVLSKRLATSTTAPPTPVQLSKSMVQQQQLPKLQKSKQVQQQQSLPKLQQAAQQQQQTQKPQKSQQMLQLETHARKLNTSSATTITAVQNSSIKAASTSNAPSSSMLPMISSVQSMAASATPPLQLLATPPHSAATTFSDQQLFSPKTMHTSTCSLPPPSSSAISVTTSRSQMSNSNSNTNNNCSTSSSSFSNSSSSSNKNINNSFKILLPPKSNNNTSIVGVNLLTSSAASSMPTPVALQQVNSGPRIAYVNSLAAPLSPTINTTKTNSNIIGAGTGTKTKNTLPTIVPVSITAAAQLLPSGISSPKISTGDNTVSTIIPGGGGGGSGSSSSSSLASVRRVKPTTLLRKNDEAWLKRTSNTTTTAAKASVAPPPITAAKNFNDDDLVLELLPHASSNNLKTPDNGKNITRLQTPQYGEDSSVTIIPNNKAIMKNTQSSKKSTSTYPMKIDLTESPEKVSTTRRGANMPTTTTTTTSSSSPSPSTMRLVQNETIDLVTNGNAIIDTSKTKSTSIERPPLSSDYEELLKVCRDADTSADMEKLVKSKLPKYYYNAHPDFVRSKGFGKSLRNVITNIQKEPDLVYLHLKTIVDELKVRSTSKQEATTPAPTVELLIKREVQTGVINSENGCGDGGGTGERPIDNEASSTGNKHTDEQIKKLNKALYILTKRIEVLESAEVDWEDEDSSYLQVERFKKRACQIYEKICDLTGESKNAHRLVKKPIHFNGTTYTQFNKTLQAYVNRTKEFPDYFDVLRMLEHCNRQYNYALANFEMKRIAHDAFIKIGRLLQSRRKTDLYETVTHFTAHEKDPATIDPTLQAKLSENQKKRTRISDVIEKYAREQDMIREELKEARQAKATKRLRSDSSGDDNDDGEEDGDDVDVASSSANAAKRNKKHKKENGDVDADSKSGATSSSKKDKGDLNKDVIDDDKGDEGDDDEDDDDEDEDDDEVNGSDLEADVEKLANGYPSDVESDVEIVNTNSTDEVTSEAKIGEEKTKDNKSPPPPALVGATIEAATKNKIKSENGTTPADTKSQETTTTTQTIQQPSKNTNDNNNTNTNTNANTSNSNNTNNIMSQKTVDLLANDVVAASTATDANKSAPTSTATTAVTITAPVAIANGCLKGVVAESGSSTTITTSTTSTTSTSCSSNNETTTTSSSTIKIVAASNLQNKISIVDGEAESIVDGKSQQQLQLQASCSDVAAIKIQPTSTTAAAAAAAAAAAPAPTTTTTTTTITNKEGCKRQRPVTEIVISDEES